MPDADAPLAARYRVTLVGAEQSAPDELEDGIKRAGAPTFETLRVERVSDGDYPPEIVHAIVFDSEALPHVSANDAAVVKKETALGTVRVYLWTPPGAPPPVECVALDDFLQKTPLQQTDGLSEEIAKFFRQARALNRRSTKLAARDAFCLAAFKALQPLWPISYLFAALHVANAVASLFGYGPWPAFLASAYVVPFATSFGAFFLVHCAYTLWRNTIFLWRIVGRFDAGFFLPAAVVAAAATATGYSICSLDGSTVRIALAVIAAAIVYRFYLYSLRIRAECSSLSEFQAEMIEPERRERLLRTVGEMRFSREAFPIFPHPAAPIFISYMHRSPWSRAAALAVQAWAESEGHEVFLDGSSIPPGGLWRQHLLRALSECGTFIAVLDGYAPATEWVLAESAYAAALRKQIGKPRILIVAQDQEAMERLADGPFGTLYADVFDMPRSSWYGVQAVVAGPEGPTPEQLRHAIARIRPMCLADEDELERVRR